jgi:hypothetical protein
MDIPTSSATPGTVSQRYLQIMFFTSAIRASDLEGEGQPGSSLQSLEVIPFLERLNHLKVVI